MREKTWIFATGNKGKIKEMETLLSPAKIKLLSLKDIGFKGDIEETGHTFEANAHIKAQSIAQQSNYPVIADDSGLQVDALGGAPGIFSARYAGPKASDEENRIKLLSALENKTNRAARFVCVICYLANSQTPRYFHGTCEGRIGNEALGNLGFGYDPIFIPTGQNKTFGQLPPEIKQKLSHRARAAQAVLKSGI